MLKKTLTIILLAFCLTANAQGRLHEMGLFLGSSSYIGELNDSKAFYEPGLSIGFLYKINLDNRYALRFSANYAGLKGDDAKAKYDYQISRDHKFDINISDFSSMLEINFLPYKPHSRFEYFSPYIVMGLGVMTMPSKEDKTLVHPIIPFGFGFKYAITKRMGIAAEWVFRKTFTDYIDQLPEQDYSEIIGIQNKQRTNNQNKDWYSFAGITFTYKFALGNSKCRAYGN